MDPRQFLLQPFHYPIGKTIREYIFIILGLFPFALMVNWIFVPHNVVGAGLTGICSLIYYATQGFFPEIFPEYGGAIPLWISSLSINALLLIIAMLTVGWQFCVRTLVGALALAFWYRIIPMRVEPLIADPVTACIVGGVVFGMSLGIVMLNNGSSGGTDIVAMIVNHYKDVSLGKVMVICDAIIIASSYFLPIPEQFMVEGMDVVDFKIKRILYGLCMTVSYTAALDWIMSRMRQSVQFFIFSNLDVFSTFRFKKKFLPFVICIYIGFSIHRHNSVKPLLELVYDLSSRYEVIDSEIVSHLSSNLCFWL